MGWCSRLQPLSSGNTRQNLDDRADLSLYDALWTLLGCRLECHCTTRLDRHAGVLGNAPVVHKCGGARGPTLRKLIAPEVVAGVEKWFFSAEAW